MRRKGGCKRDERWTKGRKEGEREREEENVF